MREVSLEVGKVYSKEFIGELDPTSWFGCEDDSHFTVECYFDGDGRYLGPDSNGVEPFFDSGDIADLQRVDVPVWKLLHLKEIGRASVESSDYVLFSDGVFRLVVAADCFDASGIKVPGFVDRFASEPDCEGCGAYDCWVSWADFADEDVAAIVAIIVGINLVDSMSGSIDVSWFPLTCNGESINVGRFPLIRHLRFYRNGGLKDSRTNRAIYKACLLDYSGQGSVKLRDALNALEMAIDTFGGDPVDMQWNAAILQAEAAVVSLETGC